MSAQWVIPGWPETDEHLAWWLQERVHDTQDSGGVGEMLKGVHADDNVCKLLRRRCEEASILNTCKERLLSRCLENVLKDINTDHALGPFSSHFNGTSSFATAEVDDNFPYDFGEEVSPH